MDAGKEMHKEHAAQEVKGIPSVNHGHRVLFYSESQAEKGAILPPKIDRCLPLIPPSRIYIHMHNYIK